MDPYVRLSPNANRSWGCSDRCALPPAGAYGKRHYKGYPDTAHALHLVPRVSTAPQVGFHLNAQTFLEVHLPRGIVGIGDGFDLGVALERRVNGLVQLVNLDLAARIDRGPVKYPVALAPGGIVFSGNPPSILVGVSALGPPPDGVIDRVIDFLHRPFAGTVTVILGPTPNERIELDDESSRRSLLVRPQPPSDFLPEGMGILLGGSHQELPFVLANPFPEKVEALLDVRDPRFLRREREPPFPEKSLHQRFHLLGQHFRGTTGDDEVSRPRNCPRGPSQNRA